MSSEAARFVARFATGWAQAHLHAWAIGSPTTSSSSNYCCPYVEAPRRAVEQYHPLPRLVSDLRGEVTG